MLPPDLHDFLIATVTASATFIGLLFVAISFAMDEQKLSVKELQTKRILAESSYAALLSIFFISLVGLISDVPIGWITLIMGWFGLAGSWRLKQLNAHIPYNAAILGLSVWIYLLMIAYGIYIIHVGHHVINERVFMALMLVLFALGLGRAWELTGVRSTYDRPHPKKSTGTKT